MDPEQSAPIGAVLSGSTLFSIEASQTFQQTRKQTTFVAIGALRVKSAQKIFLCSLSFATSAGAG